MSKKRFSSTPRCLKFRIIHDYFIDAEDLGAKARPNDSTQCAEDIVYGKLRELGRVQDVDLPRV